MTAKKPDSPEDRLARITTHAETPRFLIHWDSLSRELWYGLGSGSDAVRISSRQKLENWDQGAYDARLPKEAVTKFRNGWPRIKGKDLLVQCESLLRAYVHFLDEHLYTLLSAWVVASYMYLVFGHFEYLFFHSRFPRSGKTRVEEILSHLAFEATSPLNAPTVPTIRETAREGRTLVLDTLERWKHKSTESYSAAMELLDAGFRNGARVSKMVPYGNAWIKEIIPVFAPYILAGINRDSLADTALDRAFVIEMHRKSTRIKKQKYDCKRCEEACRPIREELYLWALQNVVSVAAMYECRSLETGMDSLGLNDRASDIWKPLFAVLKIMGATKEMACLRELAVEMGADPEVAEELRS